MKENYLRSNHHWNYLLCLIGITIYFANTSYADIVINEIMYNPAGECQTTEFVELYNAGGEPVDISGWFVGDGIRYTFPPETILQANQYLLLIENPDTFYDAYPVPKTNLPIFGPYELKLANEGETLSLFDQNSNVVDKVSWTERPPWPVMADGEGASLELINPIFANEDAGFWRAAERPTPGGRNSVYLENQPPVIKNVVRFPFAPGSDDEVVITAEVSSDSPLTFVELDYQIVEPGNYIRLDDEEYQTNWTALTMSDDGLGEDETANDGIFTALVPTHDHRTLIRYRVQAGNENELSTIAPNQTDPSPNYAYYVYDGVPPYEVENPEPTVFTNMEPVPVYQLIAHPDDIDECENDPIYDKVERKEFKWTGAFYYQGQVYDHIRYRLRGGVWRYTFNKRMWKIRFNKGQYFEGHFNDGSPYPVPRRTINLNSITQNMQINYPHRGEAGLFETTGFWLFRKVGILSPYTTWVHFRIVDDESETGRDQYSGDFYGLFLDVEQPDERFLAAHDYPEDSNLYKMSRNWTANNKIWEKETNNCDPPDDSDIENFYYGYNSRNGQDYLENHLDIDEYLSYRVILEAIHHYDVYAEKNYYYIRNGLSGLWQVLPWDLDITFGSDHGTGKEPFRDMIVGDISSRNPTPAKYTIEYKNRMREIVQLLYNEDVLFEQLDEWRDLIYDIAAADLARWDNVQPLDASPSKARYKSLDVRLQQMKDWIHQRIYINYTDNNNGPTQYVRALVEMMADEDIPNQPSLILQNGVTKYSQNSKLEVTSSAYEDPNDDFHVASRWILTHEDGIETEPDWDSGKTQEHKNKVEINLEDFETGNYQLRVKHMDITGRWSQWSEAKSITINENTNVIQWNEY